MADQQFDILISIASKVDAIDDAVTKIQQLHSETSGLSDAFDGVLKGIQLGLGVDVVGLVSQIPEKIKEAVEEGIRFNAFLETATIGVAGMLRQFDPVKYQNFNTALTDSGNLIELLRGKANQLGLSFEAMVEQYRVTAGALFAGGVTDLQKQVDLTVLLTQATAALGITGFQAQRDIFDLLDGRASRTIAGKALGVSDDDIEKAKEAGTLYEFLETKFSALSQAGAAMGNTFSASTQRAKNLSEQLLGIATKDVFAILKQSLDSYNTALGYSKDQTDALTQAIAKEQASEVARGAENVALGALKGLWDGVKSAVDGVDDALRHMYPVAQQLDALQHIWEGIGNFVFGAAFDTGKAAAFLATSKQIETSILNQVTSASSIDEQEQARQSLDAAIGAAQDRVKNSTGQTHDFAEMLLHDLQNISATFPDIVGSATKVAQQMQIAEKAAEALSKVDTAHLLASTQLSGDDATNALVQAGEAYKNTYDALTKAGVDAAAASQRALAAQNDVLAKYDQEVAAKQQGARLDEQAIEALHLKASGQTQAADALDRVTKIEQEFNRLQSEGVSDATEAWQEATKRVDAERSIAQQKLSQKDATAAERDARRDLNNFLREESELLKDIRVNQQLVNDSPFLSADAKQTQLLALYQQEQEQLAIETQQVQARLNEAYGSGTQDEIDKLTEKLRQLTVATTELGYKIQTSSFSGSFQKSLTDWVNGFGTAGQQAANVIQGTINASLQGTNQLLTGLITGSGNWKQSLEGVESQIANVFLTWIEQMALQKVASLLGITETTSAQVSSGAAIAAAHAPAAAATSISSYGAAAVVGEVLAVAAIAAIIAALAGGFEEGGYTGGGSPSSIAGVVHGGEFVFSKPATDRIGVGVLSNIHSIARVGGFQSGGFVGTGGGSGSLGGIGGDVHIYNFTDKKKLMDEFAANPANKKIIIETVNSAGGNLRRIA